MLAGELRRVCFLDGIVASAETSPWLVVVVLIAPARFVSFVAVPAAARHSLACRHRVHRVRRARCHDDLTIPRTALLSVCIVAICCAGPARPHAHTRRSACRPPNSPWPRGFPCLVCPQWSGQTKLAPPVSEPGNLGDGNPFEGGAHSTPLDQPPLRPCLLAAMEPVGSAAPSSHGAPASLASSSRCPVAPSTPSQGRSRPSRTHHSRRSRASSDLRVLALKRSAWMSGAASPS